MGDYLIFNPRASETSRTLSPDNGYASGSLLLTPHFGEQGLSSEETSEAEKPGRLLWNTVFVRHSLVLFVESVF